MNILCIILCFFSFETADCELMTNLRKDFDQLDESITVETFFKKYNSIECESARPYLIVARMKKAENTSWPNKKLEYFTTGKNNLEKFIRNNNQAIEGRYCRLLVQSKAPNFLGYNENIAEDKTFILENIDNSDLPRQYKAKMLETINELEAE